MTRDPVLTLDQFTYELPEDQIALAPSRPRDASRLLVIDRGSRQCEDSQFAVLADHLRPGDCIVVNNTRVLKARVIGTLERTGREVEVLFAVPSGPDIWEAMVRPSRRIQPDDRVVLKDGTSIEVGRSTGKSLRTIRLKTGPHATILSLIEANGTLPLPPYINRATQSDDEVDYQTTFAMTPGAVAAPTAGLHFTPNILNSLAQQGIEVVALTLHVGIGTFTPIRTENPRDHHLTPERYELQVEAADTLNAARKAGRRIIAVGTTTTRTLEYVYSRYGRFEPGQGETDLYILPGFRFQAIDGLLTNFHLPRSTLLMLVAAFAGRSRVLRAYEHAVSSGYRFYSYGDCCLFL